MYPLVCCVCAAMCGRGPHKVVAERYSKTLQPRQALAGPKESSSALFTMVVSKILVVRYFVVALARRGTVGRGLGPAYISGGDKTLRHWIHEVCR
jgi:hypothetical protein